MHGTGVYRQTAMPAALKRRARLHTGQAPRRVNPNGSNQSTYSIGRNTPAFSPPARPFTKHGMHDTRTPCPPLRLNDALFNRLSAGLSLSFLTCVQAPKFHPGNARLQERGRAKRDTHRLRVGGKWGTAEGERWVKLADWRGHEMQKLGRCVQAGRPTKRVSRAESR